LCNVATASSSNGTRPFFVLCGLLLVTGFLYWAQKVLIPVALAVLLAFILTPFVSALQRRGLGRVPSVLAVVFLVFLLLGGVGWLISQQVAGLVKSLPNYQDQLVQKIKSLEGVGQEGMVGNIRKSIDSITGELVAKEETPKKEGTDSPSPPGTAPQNPLYVTTAPSGWSRALEVAGPAGEGLASTVLVIVLVVFMLTQRENLRNRVVRLVGHGRIIVTTRAIDEGARRISGYLLMLLFINATVGVLLSAGLFLLGLNTHQPALTHTAVLWGFVAGSLRFVPYLGTWLAAALLVLFTVAILPGWGLPLGVFAYFLALELTAANVVEPLLFGHSTGSSPLALLMAAAFWAWLWGPVGLILSTPLTVILVVVGKYVPQLKFFEVLLGDEPALSTEMTFYQRLVARDLDEASELVEDYLESHPADDVYQEVLLPALILARRDRERGALDADTLEFVLRALRDIVADLASLRPEVSPDAPAEGAARPPKAVLLGCPARDEADEIALHFLDQMLRPQGYEVEVLSPKVLTAEALARIDSECPAVVCIGSLPPGGLAQARYLCKRIKSQCPAVKIAVGRWGEVDNVERVEKRLRAAGADYVATRLLETRAQVIPLLQVAAASPPDAAQAAPKAELAHSH
jgi:predicted PurR-regulated permease PerM